VNKGNNLIGDKMKRRTQKGRKMLSVLTFSFRVKLRNEIFSGFLTV
jgi:hypothetical protein